MKAILRRMQVVGPRPVFSAPIAVFLFGFVALAGMVACTHVQPAKSVGPSGLAAREEKAGVWILEDGARVLFYQREPKSFEGRFTRADYIHPLYDLDGRVLTEDFPLDHRHQRGIFWTWHQVWVGEKRIGDPWLTRDFSWDVQSVKVIQSHPESIALVAEVLWKSPLWVEQDKKQIPLVKETATVRVHRASQDYRKIDFSIQLLALLDSVTIGGSEDNKGYGGFSARIVNPKKILFNGREGPIKPKLPTIDAGPWVHFRATIDDSETPTGVAILCHPSLPVFPPPWILRNRPSMQNPVFPGREPVPLSRTEPLELRYRMILHRGELDRDSIDQLQSEYENES